MHEQSLIADLVAKAEAVVRTSGAKRAVKINVRLGALSHLSAAHLTENFAVATHGGALDGALLDVAHGTDPADPNALDLVLTSVEVEGSQD